MSYRIDTGHADEIAVGFETEEAALARAQEVADELLEPVYVSLDEAGSEDVKVRPTKVRCACGEVTGVLCESVLPRSESVILEWMPPQHRESHKAAGNSGRHPHNGASHLRVDPDCAARIIAEDGEWASIVPPKGGAK